MSEMCKENSTRSSDVEKKMESSKKQSMKFQQPKKKATLEKKPNDFESTDADRITCKGTHYFMGA